VEAFSQWLEATPASVFMQQHQAWFIPAVQTLHIIGIALAAGSVLLVCLRLLGRAAADQSLQHTQARYGAWITGALWLLLASGALLIVAEPVRELVTLSFWLKMALVVCLVVLVTVFGRYVRKAAAVDQAITPAMRWFAALTLLLLVAIIVLGRLIAYDHVWGSLSPATKA
jgi:hypothetical protein